MVQNFREVSVCHIITILLSNFQTSTLNKKYMKITLMQFFFYRGEGSRGSRGGGGDVRRVMFREEERQVIRSISF